MRRKGRKIPLDSCRREDQAALDAADTRKVPTDCRGLESSEPPAAGPVDRLVSPSLSQSRVPYDLLAVCLLLLLAVALVFGKSLISTLSTTTTTCWSENPIVARGITADGLVWAFTTSRRTCGIR